jgi:hypothetical protein
MAQRFICAQMTCLARGLNRLVEQVKNEFPEVNIFILNMKKAFHRPPSRVVVFREKLQTILLPPQLILTH